MVNVTSASSAATVANAWTRREKFFRGSIVPSARIMWEGDTRLTPDDDGGPCETDTTRSVSKSARASTATCSEGVWIQPPFAAMRRTTGPNATTVGEHSSRLVTNEQS